VDIELLVVADCPHAAAAAAALRRALVEVGRQELDFRTTVVETQAEAEHRGFTGSPTFLIDGVDPFDGGGRAGLACRIYQRSDGHGGLPDAEALRQAVHDASKSGQVGPQEFE
jgi:glutaredoxin